MTGAVPLLHDPSKYPLIFRLMDDPNLAALLQSHYFKGSVNLDDVNALTDAEISAKPMSAANQQLYNKLLEEYSPAALLRLNELVPTRRIEFVEGYGL